MVDGYKQAEERLKHLNNILRAIRNVNQLITKEKNKSKLIKGACKNFVETRGYESAWIALVDEQGKLTETAEFGVGKDFKALVERINKGKFTSCWKKTMSGPGLILNKNPKKDCSDCPLAHSYGGRGAATVKLEYDKKVYGIISVSTPLEYLESKEEKSLFAEVAEDIAFALYSIEQEEGRKKAEEDLKNQTIKLKERVKELDCLYNLSIITTTKDITLSQILNKTIDLIPPSWQYPEITCSRIIFKGKEYRSNNFKETKWKQATDIKVDGKKTGTIEVYYLEERPEIYEGPFLKEERNLINGIAFIINGIIERIKSEKELQKYSENLEKMVEDRTKKLKDAQEELIRKEKLAVLGQLSGGVGHELRNPLGVISNAAYFLKETLTDADKTTKEYLDIISQEVIDAEKIVSNLLDLSRTKPSERTEAAVSELILKILDKKHPLKDIKVTTNIPKDISSIFVDSNQISQVLTNLITNAYQAMADGGSLTINAREHKNKVHIDIIDTGCGIPKKDMEKIFEPLYTTKACGIGLGLSISKNLVEVNNGSIKAESTKGKGTTITVILPTREAL